MFDFHQKEAALALEGTATYLPSMHELALVESLVDLLVERVGQARVVVVRLEVGKLTAVVPDALRFCFEVRVQGTPLEEATLEILEIGAKGRCRSCGREAEIEGSFTLCACGSMGMEILSGNELRLKEVEVI